MASYIKVSGSSGVLYCNTKGRVAVDICYQLIPIEELILCFMKAKAWRQSDATQ